MGNKTQAIAVSSNHIEGFPLPQVDGKKTAQVGGVVLERIDNISKQAQAIQTMWRVARTASKEPTRFGCSIIALLTGAGSIYAGDLFSGGTALALGAKGLCDQFWTEDNSNLQSLLNDINADGDIIRAFVERNQASNKAMKETLALIKNDVDTLCGKLQQIRVLNAEGSEAIEEAKKQAADKILQAKEIYSKAENLILEGQGALGDSIGIYAKCSKYFQNIETIAKDESKETSIEEKIDALVQVVAKAKITCTNGKEKLEAADQKFSEGMAAFAEASKLKDEAIESISRAMQSAQDALVTGARIAQHTAECTQRIEATQKELEKVEKRSCKIIQVLDEMSTEVARAKAEAARKFNASDVVIGVSTAVLATPLGFVSGVVLGFGAACAWSNGTEIAQTTRKAYNFWRGTPALLPVPMTPTEVIRVKFRETSSGYWNSWVKGLSSYTQGTVDINLGNEEMQLHFDLNNREYPVSKEQLFSLYKKMVTMLQKGSLEPAQCRKIFTQLKDVKISRGGYHSDVVGLVKERQAAYGLVGEVLELCDKLEKIPVAAVSV